MNKQKIIGISVVAILIIVIGVVAFLINGSNEKDVDNNYTNISTDTFIGTVIGSDTTKIIVIPNKEELIWQSSFEIVDVSILENSKIYKGETEISIDEISINDTVSVTFDGKIYGVMPGKIVAQKVEVIEKDSVE